MKSEDVVLSERSQAQKYKYYMISLICRLGKKKVNLTKQRIEWCNGGFRA